MLSLCLVHLRFWLPLEKPQFEKNNQTMFLKMFWFSAMRQGGFWFTRGLTNNMCPHLRFETIVKPCV